MPNLIIAIDPGPEFSAYVIWDGSAIALFGYEMNTEVRRLIANYRTPSVAWPNLRLAIEQIGHYGTGMPAGRSVFDTCVEIGRFVQAWHPHKDDAMLILRKDIKLWHCGSMRAKDGNIRQVLIDKYGAPGTKKKPGPTYGISSHLWQAFALATYVTETEAANRRQIAG